MAGVRIIKRLLTRAEVNDGGIGGAGWLLSDNVVRGVKTDLLWNFEDFFSFSSDNFLVYARMLD